MPLLECPQGHQDESCLPARPAGPGEGTCWRRQAIWARRGGAGAEEGVSPPVRRSVRLGVVRSAARGKGQTGPESVLE